MSRLKTAMLLSLPLLGCGQADLTSTASIKADLDAYMDDTVRLEGQHVKRSSSVQLITTAPINYFLLEDATGTIRVWYNTARRRCPPRTGAEITVEGKVIESKSNLGKVFVAKSIEIDSGPELARNEVRMCQLSSDEAQIHAMEGSEALLAYWREKGKPDRVLVYD